MSQSARLQTGNQQWLHYYGQGRVADNWSVLVDGGYRWRNGYSERSQFIVRSGVSHRLSSRFRIGAGLAYSNFFSAGRPDRREWRPHQDVTYIHQVGKVALTHRLRAEERWLHRINAADPTTANRFVLRGRYAVTATLPVTGQGGGGDGISVSVLVGNELFVRGFGGFGSRIFDQNRLMLGPSFVLSPALTINLLYLGQYNSTATARVHSYQSILWLQARHQLDFRKDKF